MSQSVYQIVLGMTRQETLELYDRIKSLNIDQLRAVVVRELAHNSYDEDISLGASCGCTMLRGEPSSSWDSLLGALRGYIRKAVGRTPEEVEVICKLTIKSRSNAIKDILRKSPSTTNCVIDILSLVVPIIVEQYAGIPEMAVVGTVVILFKQGIQTYLDE